MQGCGKVTATLARILCIFPLTGKKVCERRNLFVFLGDDFLPLTATCIPKRVKFALALIALVAVAC